MSRKKIKIDWQKVDKLLTAGCDGTEAAASIGVHPDTLYKACESEHKMCFSAYKQQKKEKGQSLLKVIRFDKAMNGDTTMQIWLSKQILGETDRKATDVTTNGQSLHKAPDLSKLTDEQLAKYIELMSILDNEQED